MTSLTLFVDSTLFGVNLALYDTASKAQVWMASFLESGASASKLTDFLSHGLQKNDSNISDITQIVLSVGPGSFTGIKVGIAWVLGLKAANSKLKLASVNSLKLLTKSLSNSDKHVYVVLKNTKTHVFVGLADPKASDVSVSLMKTDDFEVKLSEREKKIVYVLAWEELSERFRSLNIDAELFDRQKTSSIVIDSISDGLKEGLFEWSSDKLPIPNYMRQPSVIERLHSNNQGE